MIGGNGSAGGGVQSLLQLLGEGANRPYEQARSLPRGFYHDPDFLALERERLFRRGWNCVGRREEIAKPGDYMAIRLCEEPIVLTHGEDGQIRALSNVCRHRGTVMASGKGNRRRIVCPYHHWSYDTKGKLIAAPRMEPRPDFDQANCRLPEFTCVEWQGFLFVSLAADPAPLLPALAGLEAMIQPYHLEQTALRHISEEVWPVNWKFLIENYMEGYHLSALHLKTLHNVNPTKLCRHFPPGEAYFGYRAGFSPDLPRSQKGHPDLNDNQRDDCVMFAVPPGLGVGCSSDYSSFICVQPETVESARVKIGLIFYGDGWPQHTIDTAIELFEKTMAEDKAILIGLNQGLKSRHYEPGPLAPRDFEGPIWDFYRFIARGIGAGGAPAS
ncbi:MAG TPA: aromatic ring-hydroxylating dioxygenase subunit alpha [Dongiaceae bacterium]|jgi:phenylpropionate dioxygenase-like ring-hydroxylating dioxygenase large terminal subunit